jgi:two-component system sensor histidine kinase UhpB
MAVPSIASQARRPGIRRPGIRRPNWARLRWADVSLYTRVVAVNSALLLAAVVVLVVTPATVSFPLAAEQGLVIGVGAIVIVVANAALLRLNFRGLRAVVGRMETIDVLRPQEQLPEIGSPEARTLINGFNTMQERLERERRASARRTLNALESERGRIGRELHDEIGQRLTGTLLELQRLVDDLPEPFRTDVVAIQEQQRATLDEVGALAWQLRPALLDDLGLVSAIEALVQSLSEPGGLRIRASLPRTLDPLSPELELVVYRIAQEALTNAVRHADASHVELDLTASAERLTLVVLDDGTGLATTAGEGQGIRGMRERALLVGGHLQVDSPVQHLPRRGGVRVRLDVLRAPSDLGR